MSGSNGNKKSLQDSVQLPIPSRTNDPLYLAHVLDQINNFNNIIMQLKGSLDDVRVIPLARAIVISIDDDEIRNSLLEEFDEVIAEINLISNAEKRTKFILQACQNAVGEVFSFIGEQKGTSLINVVVPV